MEISASNYTAPPFYALIAAAGSGTRMGAEVPKQYRKIAGKAILRHTLDVFLTCPGLKGLRVIINPAHRALYDEAVEGLTLAEPVHGGKERKDSIYNGIKEFSHLETQDIILFHDAARPLVRAHDISRIAAEVAAFGAATLAVPVADTQKYENGAYVDRNGLWVIQTPQGFHYGLITDAHRRADAATAYTDDTSLVEAVTGTRAALVPGGRANFKITTPEDLAMAERLMTSRPYETRTGLGYDVHAFTPGNKVRLCGIDIPHHSRLAGHSDADAGLHALTDALLGAIGEADIGQHFPPSEARWKDQDSAVFIRKAVELVRQRGGLINNLDVTLICEEPKIGPHKDAMRQRVADLCGIDADRVAVKATTSERLGFTGRGEGLAAQAVATVALPVKE